MAWSPGKRLDLSHLGRYRAADASLNPARLTVTAEIRAMCAPEVAKALRESFLQRLPVRIAVICNGRDRLRRIPWLQSNFSIPMKAVGVPAPLPARSTRVRAVRGNRSAIMIVTLPPRLTAMQLVNRPICRRRIETAAARGVAAPRRGAPNCKARSISHSRHSALRVDGKRITPFRVTPTFGLASCSRCVYRPG